jgi:hypothetical protein
MRRLFASVAVLVVSVLGFAGSTAAAIIPPDGGIPCGCGGGDPPPPDPLVTVTHSNNTGGATIAQGNSFNLNINLSYNGEGTLTGIRTSASWDPLELLLTNATTAPLSILSGSNGLLSKLSDPTQFSGDPAGTLRTIQYGASSGQSAGAGSVLITTLTFQVIGGLDGIAGIGVLLNSGDGCFGGACDTGELVLVGTSIAYTPIPEPGSVLLLGLGLAGLGSRRKLGRVPPIDPTRPAP